MISIKALDKIYNLGEKNEFKALKNIGLHINNNECVILKGISGSGKSTLLSIIGGMNKPTNGDVIVESKHIAKLPDLHLSNFRAKSIGFVFQAFHLIDGLSVFDNVSVPLIPFGLKQSEINQKVKYALEILKISHKSEQIASTLSGGEKQRVAIARAIVNNPNIVLLDEPTANLDIANSKNLLCILQDLKNIGKTIVVATHDTIFDDALFVDRMIYIQDGTINE
ncbi:ABC transporter ATP-binding protein [Arcobacter sp. FWKO B]|uniref:ABC transporter ATP-binding protein n=1 Tax=Arcobacter sp. FWKO B TaxID=2593672 RepID=UPI0018A5B31B|nr:ABC transporter ATP-binding protein [Arcobacter sp. FWKO B]QOG11863.1 ABC transporter ATP-binding protein [Arcobacter sp. FWKO B]